MNARACISTALLAATGVAGVSVAHAAPAHHRVVRMNPHTGAIVSVTRARPAHRRAGLVAVVNPHTGAVVSVTGGPVRATLDPATGRVVRISRGRRP